MDSSRLKQIAGKECVPQATVEKDFVLSVVLKAISESKLADKLVFKGGTAIKKLYFKEARFSEDLDFSAVGATKAEIITGLSKALDGKEIEQVHFEKIAEEKTTEGLKAAIKFRGPLDYPQRVRFDFSFRENTAKTPVRLQVIDSFNLGKCEIPALCIEEILAEKLHALASRAAPRDLYDVWFLLEKGVSLDFGMVEKKFAYYGEKFDVEKIRQSTRNIEGDWKTDLQRLLRKLPEFELVTGYVLERLR